MSIRFTRKKKKKKKKYWYERNEKIRGGASEKESGSDQTTLHRFPTRANKATRYKKPASIVEIRKSAKEVNQLSPCLRRKGRKKHWRAVWGKKLRQKRRNLIITDTKVATPWGFHIENIGLARGGGGRRKGKILQYGSAGAKGETQAYRWMKPRRKSGSLTHSGGK